MTLTEIESAIKAKKVELEVAMEMNKPRKKIMELYNELKKLQFQLLESKHSVQSGKEDLV
jgi:hypothetical protein